MSDSNSIRTLSAVAVIAGIAAIAWSAGFPLINWAHAEVVSSFSDTLSDSAPNAAANHTLEYVATNGVASGEFIEITFPAGFDLGTVGVDDVDLAEDGVDEDLSTNWSFSSTSNTIRLTSNGAGGVIAADATTTIEIGIHATNGSTGDSQIVNPSTGSYAIELTSGSQDTGETRVAILDSVNVTASIDTTFTFAVNGVGGGETVNGDTTTGTSSPTAISFGTLDPGTATTTAHDLQVTTNAPGGYTVTVQTSGALQSSTGADIDGFIDGLDTDTPTSWAAPSTVISEEDTWGHWGVTSDDSDALRSVEFGAGEYIAASTSPRIVMGHDGPSDGVTAGVGSARVGYKTEITALQEAADEYSTTLTYVATPVF